MKKLNGMKSDFSSLENKKLKNMKAIIGGDATNDRTQVATGPSGEPGNTGDTTIYVDGKKYATLSVD